MSLIKFNGTSEYLKWATLATAIQNTPLAAWTMLHGVRHNVLTGFQAYGYLLSGTGAGVVQIGDSKNSSNVLELDYGTTTRTFTGLNPAASQDSLYVVAKATGTIAPNASKKVGAAGTWAHAAASGTQANRSAAAQLQLGVWQLGDFFNGWHSVFALWNVELTQAQRIACGANWRTSDIWNAHPTKPLILMELNVPAASIVNLGSAAISGSAHVGTTLDAAETFGGWTFDGTGAAVPASNKFFPFF
jgi:hypothetical protein